MSMSSLDRGLPGFVVVNRQFLDELAGIACRSVHSRHAGSLFGSRRFKQDAVGLNVEIAVQQLLQHVGFARLVEIAAGHLLYRVFNVFHICNLHNPINRKQPFDDDTLLNGGFELVVDRVHCIDSPGHVVVNGLQLSP